MRHATISVVLISAAACAPAPRSAAQKPLVPRPVEGDHNELDVNYLQVPGNYVLLVQAGHSYGRLADTRTYVLRIEP